MPTNPRSGKPGLPIAAVAPPPTRYGPGAAQAKMVPPTSRGPAPPPTRFGPALPPPRSVQRKPARGAPPPPPPQPGRRGTVQPFGYVAAAIGVAAVASWAWNRLTNFDDVARAGMEGFAEGTESLDYYLYSRYGEYANSHAGPEFDEEWQRFEESGEADRIFCYQEDAAGFGRRVMSGEGFIWVLTVTDRLVIGSSSGAVNHSILARGANVVAAGEGHLRQTEAERLWLEWQMEKRYADQGAKGWGGARYRQLLSMKLSPPPMRRTGTVVLNLQSGHYHPKSGWRPAITAWQSAGFAAVVSEQSKWK